MYWAGGLSSKLRSSRSSCQHCGAKLKCCYDTGAGVKLSSAAFPERRKARCAVGCTRYSCPPA